MLVLVPGATSAIGAIDAMGAEPFGSSSSSPTCSDDAVLNVSVTMRDRVEDHGNQTGCVADVALAIRVTPVLMPN